MFRKIVIVWLICSSIDYGVFSELMNSSPEIDSKSEDAGLLAPTQLPNCTKYKLQNTNKKQQLNWIQSVEFCARKNARLAEIPNDKEYNCIVEVFNRKNITNPKTNIWIGAFKPNPTTFTWNHHKSEIQNKFWGLNEPQRNKTAFCASVKSTKIKGKKVPMVNALGCELKSACICVEM